MICCCGHFVGIHNAPAAPGEAPGQCKHPLCKERGSEGCGLFEPDPVASAQEPVVVRRTPSGTCGCVEIEFRDGRGGKQNCEQHCFETLANSTQSLLGVLSNMVIAFRRLTEIYKLRTDARVAEENAKLLRTPPPGPRRV